MSKIKLLAGLLILLPSMAVATVTHVTLWEALPGKSAEMMATAAKAVELNKKLGMQAVTAVDSRGRLHFAMAFEDWAQWGAYQAKAAADADMQAFVQGYSTNPSAVQLDSFMLNQPLPGEPGNVYNVFIWESYEGRSADMMTKAMEAAAIHQADGVSIAVNVDQLGRLHYVMSFDSWADWGKLQDAPSAKWTAFMGEFQANPPGKVVQTFLARQLPR